MEEHADDLLARTRDASGRACAALLTEQSDDGSWRGAFYTNAFVDSTDVIFRHYLGVATKQTDDRSARWILENQREDGGWSSRIDGASSVTNTVACYVALRMCGRPSTDLVLRRAGAFIRANGGLSEIEPWLAVCLAFVGLWPWPDVPTIPPELFMLPSRSPVSHRDLAWWTNVMLAPLSVCTLLRPVRPASFDIDELHGSAPRRPRYLRELPALVRAGLAGASAGRRALSRTVPLDRRSLPVMERMILAEQDNDGLFGGGLLFATQFAVIALHALGRPLSDPTIRRALDAIDWLVHDDGMRRHVDFCDSVMCDTALVVMALAECESADTNDAVLRGAEFLLDRQTLAGGWGFQSGNRSHPDGDDTMFAATALELVARRPGADKDRIASALGRARSWALTLQHESGAFSTFSAHRRPRLLSATFFERHEIVEVPTIDVTGHIVEWLALDGMADDARLGAGLGWLRSQQELNASWTSQWACNNIFGTYAAVRAGLAMGVYGDSPWLQAGTRWLLAHQNPDGGWGEDARTYDDQTWAGCGASTAQHTAIATKLLVDLVPLDSATIRDAVRYLLDAQERHGPLWAERVEFCPLIRSYDVWYRSPLWQACFPLLALSAYDSLSRGTGPAFERHQRYRLPTVAPAAAAGASPVDVAV